MPIVRGIKKTFHGEPTIEGAGVRLKRAFGHNEKPLFDPFLLLDDFHSSRPEDYLPGFPWHPHRGIETITYVIEGRIEHGDSMGNSGVINPGQVQWMTAGSGIIHQEMPKVVGTGDMWGLQLWANLPADYKMTQPRYRDIKASDIPEIVLEFGVRLKVICGEIDGVCGPVDNIFIEPSYLDIVVPPQTETSIPASRGHTALAYCLEGRGRLYPESSPLSLKTPETNSFDMDTNPLCGPECLILFEDGDEVFIATAEEPLRILLISGRPLGEPIAWQGPIVMNTQDELAQAFEEYQSGAFIKHRP